ncbi:hypothetical protein EST38_g4165 [Candolleomyces aberdarensis]|uniref:Nephrocystin 3-like N-terminal domain-containing protein n=1 Tax=Candolleomyces aberdarensis TaxID=2316362 RepID=A0A4Q2DNQ6_9AGAR|nr:hypothetical protein EST38_g4165 [Candolleomyces aberdarensis]
MPLDFKRPKFLSRLFSPSKDRASNSTVQRSQIRSSQSILGGAHHFQTGDLRVLNAPNATQVNAVKEAAMQQNVDKIERGRLDTLPKRPDMSRMWVEFLPNSRQPEIEELCERESSSTHLVLCVHGPAGIGKSILAGHLSDEFRSAGRLAASIFLDVFAADAPGPETIVKMIAHEIGSIHTQAIPKIVEAMDQCHGTSLGNYLQKYILEPLRSLHHPQPLIIIIDAMDEWRDAAIFIQAIAPLNSESSVVKFILTYRLNPCASRMPGIDRVSICTYSLGPIAKEVIKTYFKKYLGTVLWVDGRKASPTDVEKLSELSGGLPVWASTVIALLSHPFNESPPNKILAEIVGSRLQVGGADGLGELYRFALRRLFPSSEARKLFRRYIGATIALQESLSLLDFSMLAGIPPHLINRIQFALSALQTRSRPPGMIYPATTLFHSSFLEFLQNMTRESSFAISAFDSHSALGLTCLEQLSSLLAPSPRCNFPLCAIQHYAVKHWPYHMSNGTPRSKDQWSQTKHCSTLQTVLAAGTRKQWAILFWRTLMPEADELRLEDVGEENSMALTLRRLAYWLDQSGGDHWGFQVACLDVAVRIDNGDAEAWSELGRVYRARGDRMGSLQMYEEAVVAFRHALQLRPDSHPGHAELLDKIAIALRSSYRRNGNHDRLREAILCSRTALTLSPVPHPDRGRYLSTLANTLNHLHAHNSDPKTLNEVISLHREALALRPPPHPKRPSSLNNLGAALSDLYRCNDDIKGLNEAISLHREALALQPALHPDRSRSLDLLASTLQPLRVHNGNIDTLNEAISRHREVLALCPAPHPRSLNNLACALHSLYQYNRNIRSLDECISLAQEALALCPAATALRAATLDTLATAILSQFEQNGVVDVLNKAISLFHQALILCPPGNINRGYPLENLVKALRKRIEVTGDDQDRGEIEVLKAGLAALQPAKAKRLGEY